MDGRHPLETRKVSIAVSEVSYQLYCAHGLASGAMMVFYLQFGRNNDSANVSMGSTRVVTTIVPRLESPVPDR